MSGNEIDTRPRVCLTKPNRSVADNAERELPSITPEHIADEAIPSTPHQREITPVHLCAEYSPEPPISDFVKILYDAVNNGYSQYFFPMHPILAPSNIEIRKNRIVVPQQKNPLMEKQYVGSRLLNALQDLGEYMASTGATVNGIISLLVARQKDFSGMTFYPEWCRLLKDIRDDDTSEIELVLNSEIDRYHSQCYSLLGYCGDGYQVFPKQVHCYLFSALQDVLERETEVMVNPMFLFLCENLRCYPTITDKQVISMPLTTDYPTQETNELLAMYRLTAYGALNETRLTLSPPNKYLNKYVQSNRNEGRMFNSICASIIFMGVCCIPDVFGYTNAILSAIAIIGGFGVGFTNFIFGWIAEKIYSYGELKRSYRHKQLGYMHWKSNFIPTTAAQSAVMQIESLKMLADEITGERNNE